MSRLKWLPLSERFEIFDATVARYFEVRNQSLAGQEQFVNDIVEHTREHWNRLNIQSAELLDELKALKNQYHITKYKKSMRDLKDRVMGACRPDYEIPPDMINNVPEAKHKIVKLAHSYGLKADLDQDNGYSFAY